MPTFKKVCFYCGREFEASHSLANICSPECRKTASQLNVRGTEPRKVQSRPGRVRPQTLAVEAEPPGIGVDCLRCGAAIREATGTRRYCSPPCRRAMQRKARKEKVRRSYVEPVSITVLRRRDNDTCGICGKPVDFEGKPPAPSAATIDHVVALARGGEHSYRNTQLAHFRCNSSKGAG